jgi:hypothetical protein
MNTFLCIRWPARIAAGALVACLGLAALPAQALNVQCHVNYGGEDRVLQSPPTATPLAAPSVEVGSYFLLRLVNTLTATHQPAFKVYVYAAHDSGPATIQATSHSPRAGAPRQRFRRLHRRAARVRTGARRRADLLV